MRAKIYTLLFLASCLHYQPPHEMVLDIVSNSCNQAVADSQEDLAKYLVAQTRNLDAGNGTRFATYYMGDGADECPDDVMYDATTMPLEDGLFRGQVVFTAIDRCAQEVTCQVVYSVYGER